MKVLVIDDHALVRAGIRQVLQTLPSNGGVDVLEAPDGEQALKLLENQAEIDLILMDYDLPKRSGLAILSDLGRQHPEIPVIMISGVTNPTMVRSAMQQGASAFLTKTGDSQELLKAVQEVMAGNSYVSKRFNPDAPRRSGESAMPVLSERQLEVIRLLAEGLSNRDIAQRLFVSEETIKSHVGVIFKVFNVHSRVEAVNQARLWGYTSA